MHELAGGALISFEGNLKGLRLLSLAGGSLHETAILKRATIWPTQDFIVLPLEAAAIPQLLNSVGGIVSRRVLHVQIEKAGVLQFGAYDNFDCISLSPALSGSDVGKHLRPTG